MCDIGVITPQHNRLLLYINMLLLISTANNVFIICFTFYI